MKQTNPTTNQYYRKMGAPGLWPVGPILMTILLCLVAQLANAGVQVRSTQLRFTVPDLGTQTDQTTNYVAVSGTPGTETLSVVGSLPTGDTTMFSTLYPLSATSTNFGTWLTNTAVNVPDGLYPIDLNVSGSVVNDLILTLQSGRMWAAEPTNSTALWSSGSSWVGGTAPTASSDVLFTWMGGQTNFMVNGTLYANSEVDQNFTIASLRFSQSTNGSLYHSITIDPGKTLSITGAGGLSLLQDSVALGTGMFAVFSGVTGTLNVNNPNANIALLLDNSTQHTLDLQRLGTFTANINRFAAGDYTAYPNYSNLLAEGFSTGAPFIMPNKFYTHTYLAMTNFITANYVDPGNYTNSNTNRLYAIEIGNNPLSAPSSSAAQNFSLGITNVIKADGVCVSGFGGTTVTMNFNPGLRIQTNIVVGVSTNYVTNSMYAIFRNTDGASRMSIFTIGDLANPLTNSAGNTKGNVDFSGNGGGYVDLLVDRFYMSRDRTNCVNGDDAQTTFGMGAGVLNANTMVIGDQESGDQINQGYVYGTLTVSNTAVVVANNSLQLGYDTADYNDASQPGVSHGILNINAGGTVKANTIGVGGPSGNSGEVGTVGPSGASAAPNTISMNGGNLIVSNVIASASCFATNPPTANSSIYFPGMLGVLNMVNSSLELFLNGNQSGPYVNTCQLTYTGSTSNTIVIGSIQNIAIPNGSSTNIPFMWIQDASPNASAVSGAFTRLVLPAGYEGALVLDATNNHVLDLTLSQHIPKNLKWEGYVNSTWDTTSTNWLDLATGLHTNYFNGDNAIFDDSTIITNITVSGAIQLLPNSIAMTNNTGYYKFTGSSLLGGATFTKAGTGFLEVDSQMILNFQLNNGTLTGNGTIGGVTEATGATLNYSGTINGNVTCAGLGLDNGNINGLLTVSSGGVFTNFSALNGAFNVQSNGFLYNANIGTITYGLGNTGSIATNGIMVNIGKINGDVLSDGGTFEDNSGNSGLTLNSLSIVAGGEFYPAGDTVGETTINPSSLGGYGFPGAMLLVQGSTTVLNVNNASTYTTIDPIFMSFGGSATSQTENGATLQINNLGPAFTAGQTFNFFVGPPVNTGSSTNTYPVISPATPGPGLAWDLTKLWSSGSIGVITANNAIGKLTNSFTIQGTNVIIQLSWGNNNIPANQSGYRLETENNPLAIGLSNNWSGVSGSWTNQSASITNTIGTNNAVFYRLVFP